MASQGLLSSECQKEDGMSEGLESIGTNKAPKRMALSATSTLVPGILQSRTSEGHTQRMSGCTAQPRVCQCSTSEPWT